MQFVFLITILLSIYCERTNGFQKQPHTFLSGGAISPITRPPTYLSSVEDKAEGEEYDDNGLRLNSISVERCERREDTFQTHEDTCDSRINDQPYSINIEATYQIDPIVPYRKVQNNIPRDESHVETTHKSFISKLAARYVQFLGTHALLTKSVTSGLVGSIGDIMAQLFEHKLHGLNTFTLNFGRIFGIFFECAVMSTPLMHYAYDFLEELVPINDEEGENLSIVKDWHDKEKRMMALKKWRAAMFHVLADIFILGPIYVLNLMVSACIFEGRIHSLKRDLCMNFIPTLKPSVIASLGFMPTQMIAFKMLPIQFRILYINVQDIVWNAIVSFAAHRSH